MSIITISRGSYSHGINVAEKLAKRLGYECVSRGALIGICKEFNIPEIKLTRAIRKSPSLFERYTFAREKYMAFIRTAILEYLSQDNVIYHGFAGHFFVRDVPHILKVRINADLDRRTKCLIGRGHASNEEEACNMVEQIDKERREWGKKLYGIDTWDCRLYDLVIDIEQITTDDAVDIICHTVKLKPFQTTPESHELLVKLAIEARKKLEEFRTLGSPFFEPMREMPWKK